MTPETPSLQPAFYMVGDYPEIDIAGGKKNDMETVLVESGLYSSHHSASINMQHAEYLQYADHIVPNIEEAVNVIL